MDALFTPWRPDATGFSKVIDGVQPIGGVNSLAYGPLQKLSTFSAALGSEPRGFISVTDSAGARINIAGTETTWERLAGDNTWTELASGYALDDGFDWSFRKFGDVVLGSCAAEGLLAYDVETPSGVNAVSGAPSFVRIWVQQVRLLGIYFDTYWRVACSGINDHTLWNGAGGSDELPLKDGGEAITGCEFTENISVVFQRNAIRRVLINAVPGRVLTMNDIAVGEGVGSIGAASVIPFKQRIAFISAAGAQMIDTDGSLRPIGAEKINRWLVENVNDLAAIKGGVDPKNHLFKWQINDSQNLIFDWQLDEFTTVPQATTFLCAAGLPASDMDASEVIADDADMDATGFPGMDSRFWSGGEPEAAGFSSDYKLGFFDGDNYEATLQTPEIELPMSTDINQATVLTDAAVSYTSIAYADSPGAALTYTSEVPAYEGIAYTLAQGKRLLGQLRIPEGTDYSEARGFGFINEGGR